MADGAEEYEEVKYGVHVRFVVHGVENGTGDVGHALGYNPSDGRWRHAGDEGLKCYEHAEAHQAEAEGFDVAVFLQVDKVTMVPAMAAVHTKAKSAQPHADCSLSATRVMGE